MRNDFGVRLRRRTNAALLEFRPQCKIVIGIAFMNKGEAVGLMWMRFGLERVSMGRPTRMPDARVPSGG